MATDDVFPPNDDDFHKVQKQFIDAVSGDPAKYGVPAQEVTSLMALQTEWNTAFPAYTAAQNLVQTKLAEKNAARAQYEAELRKAARKLGPNNALRVSAGLPPVHEGKSSIGAPTTRPIGRIDMKPNRTIVIHFVDEQTPKRLAKPHGVHGCEIWSFVGDTPPANPSGYSFLALDTRTPYTDAHDAEDGGKTAYYLLRWQNSKGEPGPWSDVVMAKIPL